METRQIYYRFESRLAYDGEGGIEIQERRFAAVKKTPRGAWVVELNPYTFWQAAICDGFFKRFVLDGARKRYCYPTQDEALLSFRKRKECLVSRLENNLLVARAALRVLAFPDFEPGKIYHDETLAHFCEY